MHPATLVGSALAAALAAPGARAGADAGAAVIPILENPQPPAGTPVHRPAAGAEARVGAGGSRATLHGPERLQNIHTDAYQTDTYTPGRPLGCDIQTSSARSSAECASSSRHLRAGSSRSVSGSTSRSLALIDPETLEPLATLELPPRHGERESLQRLLRRRLLLPRPPRPGGRADDHPSHVRHLADRRGRASSSPVTTTLAASSAQGDKIISVLPDWRGSIWFATGDGVGGWIDRRRRGDVAQPRRADQQLVRGRRDRRSLHRSDRALYRFALARATPAMMAATVTPTPARSSPASRRGLGTTPTILGRN